MSKDNDKRDPEKWPLIDGPIKKEESEEEECTSCPVDEDDDSASRSDTTVYQSAVH